jgi:hypothetical protein
VYSSSSALLPGRSTGWLASPRSVGLKFQLAAGVERVLAGMPQGSPRRKIEATPARYPERTAGKGIAMRIQFRYLLAAGAVAAMVGAPSAMAEDPGQSCVDTGAATQCTSPGNVEINDAPPVVTDPFSEGVYGGPYPVPFDEGSG